jgi:NAD(P)-dependent dehydrogenase (short-subunit alcohol dehydrogenase family)
MSVLDMFRLDGKVAIVTGASSGLGVAFAHALAQAGADVALGARRADKLESVADAVRTNGRSVHTVVTDVAKPEDCDRLVAETMERFGRVDILVNNAGVGTAVPATRETPEQFRDVIDVNLNGSYWMAQACGRVMQPGSSIVNISSVLGLTTAGLPQAAYAASKAGIIGLTRDLAQQWTGRKGIRVNAIAPGFFASEMTEQYPDGYLDMMGHPDPRRPQGRRSRTRRHLGLVGLRRGRLCHGPDRRRRRRHDDHVSGRTTLAAARMGEVTWPGSVGADALAPALELEAFFVPTTSQHRSRCVDGRHNPDVQEGTSVRRRRAAPRERRSPGVSPSTRTPWPTVRSSPTRSGWCSRAPMSA